MLEVGGYKEVGYQYIIIDDCWLDHTRDKVRSTNQFENLKDDIRSASYLCGICIYDDNKRNYMVKTKIPIVAFPKCGQPGLNLQTLYNTYSNRQKSNFNIQETRRREFSTNNWCPS